MAEDTTTTTPEEAKEQAPAAAQTEAAEAPAPKKAARGRRKTKRTVASGQVHVQASFNNTIITFTDASGNVLTSSSAGACGFRGSKKGTAYAAQVAAERAAQAA
ncbi:MAG TPA: 30S ribosomal protein S11, partial [Candidatus Saccharimonadales bacterium]|nr:30S ribosomal protein S11 [Candidatus Saccharimonadales bacterium]